MIGTTSIRFGIIPLNVELIHLRRYPYRVNYLNQSNAAFIQVANGLVELTSAYGVDGFESSRLHGLLPLESSPRLP